jgi:hypothetical protein
MAVSLVEWDRGHFSPTDSDNVREERAGGRSCSDHAALAFTLLAFPSCWTPSTKTMPARTSGRRCAPSSRRHRALRHVQKLVGHQQALGPRPAPFVTRCRSRTVANGDSMTLLVLRCFQCSAGKSKNVSSWSASFSSVVTAFE